MYLFAHYDLEHFLLGTIVRGLWPLRCANARGIILADPSQYRLSTLDSLIQLVFGIGKVYPLAVLLDISDLVNSDAVT